MKEFWTSLASLMGVFAFCQGILQTIFPPELRFAVLKLFQRAFNCFSSYCYFDITEIDGVNTNELYNAAHLYLSSSASVAGSRLTLTRALNSSAVTFGLSNADSLVDTFRGAAVRWEHVVSPRQSPNPTFSWRPVPDDRRSFTLRVRKRDKPLILSSYLDHVTAAAADIRRRSQDRLLYTNPRGGGAASLDARGHPWEAVPFKHPSTFETLAMDPARKARIMADLRDFAAGEAFYRRAGRAWKRGYLLYGPPGTGKSSMIAAIANFLRYDIYDLELTEVHTNSELRKLLMKTTSKSIVVIEDIDCSIDLTSTSRNRRHRKEEEICSSGGCDDATNGSNHNNNNNNSSITLSGLLNFTDGLWSCCGSERIFVFTTNHVERLDPALLRSGRMDMHIHMSYCTFPALKILLRNYLEMEEGDLPEAASKDLEAAMEAAAMTPADVSELLIKNRRDKGGAVEELVAEAKRRAGRNRGNNGGSREAVEEEEQEKRALENPKGEDEEGLLEFEESCRGEEEEEDEQKKS